MSHSNTALHQILKPIIRHEFESLASKHHSEQKLRSASRRDQFVGMLMSQLSGRQSLRYIQSNLGAQRHQLYHIGAKPLAKSTLARLNDHQPSELYESLFYKLQQQMKRQPGEHKFRFKNPLYSTDASAIDLSLKLFPWAAHRGDTANVKLSVGLNHATEVPEVVFKFLCHFLRLTSKGDDICQNQTFPSTSTKPSLISKPVSHLTAKMGY